jgi:hypothetical protein
MEEIEKKIVEVQFLSTKDEFENGIVLNIFKRFWGNLNFWTKLIGSIIVFLNIMLAVLGIMKAMDIKESMENFEVQLQQGKNELIKIKETRSELIKDIAKIEKEIEDQKEGMEKVTDKIFTRSENLSTSILTTSQTHMNNLNKKFFEDQQSDRDKFNNELSKKLSTNEVSNMLNNKSATDQQKFNLLDNSINLKFDEQNKRIEKLELKSRDLENKVKTAFLNNLDDVDISKFLNHIVDQLEGSKYELKLASNKKKLRKMKSLVSDAKSAMTRFNAIEPDSISK